ncbi:hypothetical protein mru_0428 [Methanobrevibacter ruminantium M1]|uniref:Stage II sporulation protein M n=1 Tax=Methanobrevibacter ruminantium (strain ATCC 35063 / DSM 1093 / JCM 13430 / OCM 146 / M1) TaxID=634498 RepID=D3E0N3_METRM|nr:stage II sporulation protein M [Methanobrevibacter ruminantium]ADC46279.1 hypothetical protein mru_0428 [Methanobrevibacter ruminantium M1]
MNIKELFIESLKDNKKLIIGLYAFFIIVFIAAWIITGPKMQAIASNVTAMNGPGGAQSSAIELFIHNELGGIITYLASVFFGIAAIVLLGYNALNLGSIGQLFNHFMPNGGILYLIYLIPHGIFEITATVLQSAAGILLFLFIWRFIKAFRSKDTNGASDAFEMTKKTLIQSIVLMVIATILLLIAAPIEAYFSTAFSEFIMGFLGLR